MRRKESTIYLRGQRPLSKRDQQDLLDYEQSLRQYYEIPADKPVFPKRKNIKRTKVTKTSENARNTLRHPWRQHP